MARILNTLSRLIWAIALTGLGAGPALGDNVANGAKVFRSQCAICHGSAKKAPPSVGPDLFGVIGAPAGAVPGYQYSAAMKHSGLTWTPTELKRYLANPKAVVVGNKMPYAGLRNSAELDDLITYLATLK
jgi:cytochrome c